MEEIMDNLQEQAMEDKKMRSYAVIPPILLDAKERKVTYQNNNGHIDDMEAEYKSRQYINIWTPSEKEIFKEKYLQHPKNFGVIASYLERKSVADCVQYYYLSKKTENYKQLLRKSRLRARSSRNNPQKVNSSANISVVDIMTTRVTTRLQREQQQKTGNRDTDAPSNVASSTTGSPQANAEASPSAPGTSSPPPASTVISGSTTTTTVTTTEAGTPERQSPTENVENKSDTEESRCKPADEAVESTEVAPEKEETVPDKEETSQETQR